MRLNPFTHTEMFNWDEKNLVLSAQNGRIEAFTELVRRYHGRIFNAVYAQIGHYDDAEDLTQEIFLKAYRLLASFEGRSKFYTWLYRIAVNCALDWLKSPKRQKCVLVEQDYVENFEQSIDPKPPQTPDAAVRNRELQELLEQALQTLPEEMRQVIVLREIDGFDYVEIADILKCSIGTVKSRLFRARTRLKDLWDAEYKARWDGIEAPGEAFEMQETYGTFATVQNA